MFEFAVLEFPLDYFIYILDEIIHIAMFCFEQIIHDYFETISNNCNTSVSHTHLFIDLFFLSMPVIFN